MASYAEFLKSSGNWDHCWSPVGAQITVPGEPSTISLLTYCITHLSHWDCHLSPFFSSGNEFSSDLYHPLKAESGSIHFIAFMFCLERLYGKETLLLRAARLMYMLAINSAIIQSLVALIWVQSVWLRVGWHLRILWENYIIQAGGLSVATHSPIAWTFTWVFWGGGCCPGATR